MSRCTIRSLITAILFLLPCAVYALSGPHDPATGGRGYTCKTCHTAGNTIGAASWSNVCNTCHNGGVDPAGGAPIKQFKENDYANPYAAETRTGKVYQTSHKWFGSDNIPQAGALPPVDATTNGMNKKLLIGSMTCARCHNLHGDSVPTSINPPYLRLLNDSDQMCLNCHRPRDKKSHMLGTHPVNVTYTSAKVKANPTQYLTAPLTNPTNPTAQVKLVNGKVVCSSCHGVHFTDSNSRTFDNHSAAFGGLSTSNGILLRVDARSAMSLDGTTFTANICTNCHIKDNHSTPNKKANIQCNDCHSGHVEYIKPEDVLAGEGTPNVYLLRRYVNYSAGVKLTGANAYRRKVFFQTTSSQTTSLLRSDGKGICQGCHTPPATVVEHATASVASDCAGCHSGGVASIAAIAHSPAPPTGCTGCHGQPPASNSVGTGGKSSALYTTFNESLTPHTSHAGGTQYNFVCNECHQGNTHNSANTFTDVFISTVGRKAGASASYASPTCTAVYCHSSGNGTYKGGVTTVAWGNNKGSIIGQPGECTTCHDISTYSASHTKHITTMGYGCVTCHSATVSDNTTLLPAAKLAGGTHVNTLKDIQFSGAAPVISGSSCSTVACHSNGKGAAAVITPDWTNSASGACGACHATAASAPALATGTHTAHFAVIGSTVPATVCVKCHTYNGDTVAPHVNGTIDVTTGCATNNCHGTIANPVWGANTSSNTCTKCHGTGTVSVTAANRYVVAPSAPAGTDTGQVSANAKTGAHQTHLRYLNGFSNYSTVDYRCEACHGTLPVAGTHADGLSTPSFQKLAIKWGASTASFGGGSCSNVYCHNPAAYGVLIDSVATSTPSWTDSTYLADGGKSLANCQLCHKVPGSAGFSKQTAHGSMVTDASVNQCNSCHGHNGDATGAIGQRHIDGIRYASGSCNSCHGYPPMTQADYDQAVIDGTYVDARVEVDGGGGYHKKHLLPTVVATEGFTPCLPCHPSDSLGFHMQGGASVVRANVNVNYATDTNYRFDGARSKRYDSVATKCSNISCHFKPSPAWNL